MQQGRSLAGLVHKELSTKVMEVVAPDVVPKTQPVPSEMMDALRQSLDELHQFTAVCLEGCLGLGPPRNAGRRIDYGRLVGPETDDVSPVDDEMATGHRHGSHFET